MLRDASYFSNPEHFDGKFTLGGFRGYNSLSSTSVFVIVNLRIWVISVIQIECFLQHWSANDSVRLSSKVMHDLFGFGRTFYYGHIERDHPKFIPFDLSLLSIEVLLIQ